jgi:hypothetical protein
LAEEETYFLFVFWSEDPQPGRIEGNTEFRDVIVTMRRTSLQRPVRAGEKFRRVPVDFDPLGKHLVYCVVCFFKSNSGSVALSNIVRPAVVLETQEEAEELKKQMESGGYKEFAERKEKLDRVEIHPLVVTVQ